MTTHIYKRAPLFIAQFTMLCSVACCSADLLQDQVRARGGLLDAVAWGAGGAMDRRRHAPMDRRRHAPMGRGGRNRQHLVPGP
jgi:hypothetical protein